jgi:hypothetical protein
MRGLGCRGGATGFCAPTSSISAESVYLISDVRTGEGDETEATMTMRRWRNSPTSCAVQDQAGAGEVQDDAGAVQDPGDGSEVQNKAGVVQGDADEFRGQIKVNSKIR